MIDNVFEGNQTFVHELSLIVPGLGGGPTERHAHGPPRSRGMTIRRKILASLRDALCGAVVLLLGTAGTAIAAAGGVPGIPFVDGRWYGDVRSAPTGSDLEECWASTTFDDGTTFTLAERSDKAWSLQLSNPSWSLPASHRYSMVALVDFYPRLRVTAVAKDQTLLEIADIEQISLLGLIENGHTIDLASDGFTAKYELEGSAKVIERIRDCFVHPAREDAAAD